MSNQEIERIKNLPMEERKDALLNWINKMKAESPDTIVCLSGKEPDFLEGSFDLNPEPYEAVEDGKCLSRGCLQPAPVPSYLSSRSEGQKDMNEWINCADRLPEIDQEVLSYCENVRGPTYPAGFKYFALDKYLACGFRTDMFYGKVLYWMPLPAPPD